MNKVDRSRPCAVCGKVFTPKYSDGPKKDKYKTCSVECTRKLISSSKIKYTEEQIKQVIEFKQQFKTNKEISELTGVNINKIKEITKENKLFLPKKERIENAYNNKIKNDPDCMEKMRQVYQDKIRSDEKLEEVKKILLERGFEYVRGFEKQTSQFTIKCSKCGKEKTVSKLSSVHKDKCCLCINLGISKPETELKEWIKSLGLTPEKYLFTNAKNGREIDIYVPELKIGIEYCGLYWHNENSPTPRKMSYHFGKMQKANQEGIRLITVFEDEWKDRELQVKNLLRSILNKNSQSIYARKTQLKIVSKQEADIFLEQNHIQGTTHFKIAFGLYYENELIAVITGGEHHRQGHNRSLILSRLAFKDNLSVVGGSSKLLKYLIEYAKEENYTEIISWSDNRWSEGNVYKKLGFSLQQELLPDYSYVCNNNRLSKQSCQKSALAKKGAVGNTELEMANSLHYYRIWDCGKKRWQINV